MQRIDFAPRPLRALEPRRSLRIVRFLALVVAVALVCLAAPRAFGDGVFVPPADTRIPGEPAQRALIVHRAEDAFADWAEWTPDEDYMHGHC